jgi:hypothetical protein
MAFLVITSGAAQAQDLRSRLETRGVPSDFRDAVLEVARDAENRGLPVNSLGDKAIEGWAKGIPQERVLTVVRQMVGRLETAQDVVRGVGRPDTPRVVAAAADALGREMTPEQVGSVIRAAPTPEAAAAGLTVSAALAAQGLERGGAAESVVRIFENGQPLDQVLELPSFARSMMLRGVPASDIVHQIIQAGGIPGQVVAGGQGQGRRPPGVPPRGPPAGKGKRPPNE